ncbi:MAG TPA: peptide ABC transporter substrate-binding protein [Candidatus Brocadiia bacterium]|nr:peptide ABC transporter substrate-binding protein [Candidatus Brocadiia bacterium]
MYRFYIGLVLLPLAICALSFSLASRDTDSDFSFRNGPEPQTCDPGIATDMAGHRIARALFEGLTVFNPRTLEPEPGIAERWEVSEDGRQYTFFLRRSLWSDGRSCTAHDFRYGWLRVLSPETGSEYINLLYYIRNAKAYAKNECRAEDVGLKVIDDHTFRVELEKPVPFFLSLAAFATYFPEPSWAIEKHGRNWVRPENIVCNGPYVLKKWALNDHLLFEKNPLYWDAANVSLKKILALSVESSNTGLNLYETGQCDLLLDLPPELIHVLRDRRDYTSIPSLSCTYYRFNVTKPPLNDARVRLALSLAIDRKSIAQRVLMAGEVPARSFVPPGMPGYASAPCFEEDVERARALLAEAGFPGGNGFPKLTLVYNTSMTHKAVAEAVQQMWKERLNVSIGLENVEWKTLLHRMTKLEYEICRAAWIGDYVDPTTFLEIMRTGDGNNRTGWSNAEYDALLDVIAMEANPERRNEIMHQAEQLLIARESPIAPIYFGVNQLMHRGKVNGLWPNALGLISFKHLSPAGPDARAD